MAKIEQKHLEGLVYRGNEEREVTDGDGTKKKRYFPVARPLVMADIIKQEDNGDTFHIVTADGRKYDVLKNPKKATGPGAIPTTGEGGKNNEE